ncbi:unnamed protein product [Cyprideis torosa]|uniref:Uncharacterized protein n=1 Tax=Cyprideis torosa TaxID=163714 RepID=A0A7R8W5B0_9CRUS|nr:unnamed protein product [Cyprideis torosa]CAG0885060.1 unnamed protein product [Cyprideis torosa]
MKFDLQLHYTSKNIPSSNIDRRSGIQNSHKESAIAILDACLGDQRHFSAVGTLWCWVDKKVKETTSQHATSIRAHPGSMSETDASFLQPDHPLLEKYQAVLKAYLERTEAAVEEQLREERKAHDIQRRERLQLRKENVEVEKKFRETLERTATEALYMEQAQENIDIRMDIIKNTLQKTDKTKIEIEEAKQKQDLFICRLTAELSRKDEEAKYLRDRIQLELDHDLPRLEQQVREVGKDVDEAEKHKKMISAGWKQSVLDIGRQSEALRKRESDADRETLKMIAIKGEIRGLKKETTEQFSNNEQLTAELEVEEISDSKMSREFEIVNRDLENLDTCLFSSLESQTKLEEKLRNQKKEERQEKSGVERKQREFQITIQKVEKLKVAEVDCLRSSIRNESVVKHLKKVRSRMDDKGRNVELKVIDVENEVTALKISVSRSHEDYLLTEKGLVDLEKELQEEFRRVQSAESVQLKTQSEENEKKLNDVLEQERASEQRRRTWNLAQGKIKGEVVMVERSINDLRNTLTQLNEALRTERTEKDGVRGQLKVKRLETAEKLKAIEKEVVECHDRAQLLEKEQRHIRERILVAEEAIAEWEKKLALAKDVSNRLSAEDKEGGGKAELKAELKRTQIQVEKNKTAINKLCRKLEASISRREVLERKAVSSTGGLLTPKMRPGSKSSSILRQMRSAETAMEKLEKCKNQAEELQAGKRKERAELEDECDAIQVEIDELIQDVASLEADWYLNERDKGRKKNSVQAKQEFVRNLVKLRTGSYKRLIKDDGELKRRLTETKQRNDRINKVLESLLKQYPMEFTRLMAGTSLPPHQQVIIRNPIPPSFFEASSRPFFDGASRNSVYTPFLRPSAVQTRVIPEEVNVSDDDDVKPDIRSSFVSTPIHTRLHSVFDNGDNNLKPSVRSRLSGGNLGQQPYVTPVRFPTPQATKFYHRQRRSIFQRLGVRGYGNYSRSFYNSNYGTRTRWRGGRRGFGFRWSGRSWGRYGPVRRSFICVDGLGEYRILLSAEDKEGGGKAELKAELKRTQIQVEKNKTAINKLCRKLEASISRREVLERKAVSSTGGLLTPKMRPGSKSSSILRQMRSAETAMEKLEKCKNQAEELQAGKRKERAELEDECDAIQVEIDELIQDVASLEADWYLNERDKGRKKNSVQAKQEFVRNLVKLRTGSYKRLIKDDGELKRRLTETKQRNDRINKVLESLLKQYPMERNFTPRYRRAASKPQKTKEELDMELDAYMNQQEIF